MKVLYVAGAVKHKGFKLEYRSVITMPVGEGDVGDFATLNDSLLNAHKLCLQFSSPHTLYL